MNKRRIEISKGIFLDHRRAIYLEEERTLAIADLHLGYAWAHRFNGQLLPLPPEDTISRLSAICADYHPLRLAILGDIVHQAVPIAEVRTEFAALIERLGDLCGLKLILGNHDKALQEIAREDAQAEFLQTWRCGRFLLLHGNKPVARQEPGTVVVIGHEHPAISLGDGIRSAKFPCFMVSEQLIILPAFSLWSAGSDIRAHTFMSSLARDTRFEKAVAICGEKLLPVPLP